MNKQIAIAAIAATLAMPAAAVTINFDGASGPIGATYAGSGVTFSNAQTFVFGLAGETPPNTVASISSDQFFGPGDAVVATFAFDVTSVSILGLDIGEAGLRLEAFDSTLALVDFDQFVGVGIGSGNINTLSVADPGIRSVRIFQITPCCGDGVGFDNFSFEAAPAPAPATLGLLGLGLLGLAAVRRRVA